MTTALTLKVGDYYDDTLGNTVKIVAMDSFGYFLGENVYDPSHSAAFRSNGTVIWLCGKSMGDLVSEHAGQTPTQTPGTIAAGQKFALKINGQTVGYAANFNYAVANIQKGVNEALQGFIGETRCSKHTWVDTGTKMSYCKHCDADGEWDSQEMGYKLKAK